MERPLGVSLLAGIAGLFGVMYFALGLVALSGPLSPEDAATFGLDDTGTKLAMLAIGVALLVFTVGSWMEWMWAWFFGVGLSVVAIAGFAYRLINGGSNSGSILAILLFAVILVYLATPGARKAFHLLKAPTEEPAS